MHKTKKEQDSMGTQRYSILYSSKTGNTKKLAEKIREVLPEENCDYFGTEGAKALSLEQQVSEAVKPISSRFSGKLKNLWMRVIQ